MKFSTDLLEFEAVKAILARYVSSPAGRRKLAAIEPSNDRAGLSEKLAETAEALAYHTAANKQQPLTARGAVARLSFESLPDVDVHAAKLRVEGSVLDGSEIRDITSLLDRACDVRAILNNAADRYPRLGALSARIADFRPLVSDLNGKIEPDGSVADNASVALHRIRREMARQQGLIQESLERFLRKHRDDGILQEEFVTFRNERFVLPIVAGQKRKVDGIIHAASGTGQTLFIEPMETVELNNDLVRLREQEMREVHRILQELTVRLRGSIGDIRAAVVVMGDLELLFGKARFAADFDCTIPIFSPDDAPRLDVRHARHPLLVDVLTRQRKSVVPLALTLEGSVRTLLISGPNTGGKTVALKTIGVVVLMAQAGLPVPAEHAEFPVFDQVLADIGDHQSLEQSLSTFSAHIVRIKEILETVESGSLVLIDELGRATDPDEGGALAVAVLDRVRNSGAFTLASTHLVAPKIYGATTAGVLNGAMSFDEETLAPTYQLRTGAPGASAGLDIAQRLGLPRAVIDQARSTLTDAQRSLGRLLKLLEERLDAAERRERELTELKSAMEIEQRQLKEAADKREAAKIRELERKTERMLEQFEARARETIDRLSGSTDQRKFVEHSQRKIAQAGREMRQERDVSVSEMCALMLEAQHETYGPDLETYHPYMWAVKGHYYGPTFYNYPYTFGLLFGLGLYMQFKLKPEGFREQYDEFLSSTGLADAATLAKGFGIDIRDIAFWRVRQAMQNQPKHIFCKDLMYCIALSEVCSHQCLHPTLGGASQHHQHQSVPKLRLRLHSKGLHKVMPGA